MRPRESDASGQQHWGATSGGAPLRASLHRSCLHAKTRRQAEASRIGAEVLQMPAGQLIDPVARRPTETARYWELGCGTAHVLAPCAAAAGGGVGVDVSPAMLRRARRLAASGLADWVALHLGDMALHLGDMRSVRLDRRFPLVTIPSRSMFHLR
jgi:hypothetical protein